MKKKGKQRKRYVFLVLLGLLLIFAAFIRLSHVSYSSQDYEKYPMMDDMDFDQAAYNEQANEYLQENGVTTPLYLQTNEEWADYSYGSDGTQTLSDNGCALLSL